MTDNERLSRELRDRAAHAGGHPISFDDVKRSATKMKWQQRAAAGAVAAVALAVAIPVGLSVAGNGDGTNRGDGVVATPTPTPTPDETPTQGPDPDGDGKVTLTLDAPGGPTPRISWMEGKTLHLAGGGTEQLAKAYSDVVSYHGGFLGLDYSTGAGVIDVIRGGDVVDSYPGMGFVVSTDGTEVAWYEGGVNGGVLKRGIVSGMGEGEESVDVPAGYLVTPLFLTPSTRLVYSLENQSEPYDKTIWFTDFLDDAHQIKGALAVGGYNDLTGSLAVMTELQEMGSCWALYGFGGGEAPETFGEETCDYSLGEFSADGNYVIGWDAYRDGWGNGDIAILDAETLEPVMVFEPERDYGVQAAAWDSDENALIASVYLDGTWQLVRLGVDGSIETVSGAVEADDVSNPFLLVDVR